MNNKEHSIFRKSADKEGFRKPLSMDINGLKYVSGAYSSPKQEDWFVFSVVRNEMLRLPYFLEYYREMGAGLFIVADNCSDDGTATYLSGQPDVLLFEAPGKYSDSGCGVDWVNAMLQKFGRNKWCLTVDADELLVFPYCEQRSMLDLIRYLEATDANALQVFLLDMYSKEPIREAVYKSGTPFLSACPYFDSTGYLRQKISGDSHLLPSRGGARARLFWEKHDRDIPLPFLHKIPLIRWTPDISYKASTHILSSARFSDVTGALLHFKLFSDFTTCVEEEIGRNEHYKDASEYRAYWEVISSHSDLCAYHDSSIHYSDSQQLIDMDLLYSSEGFSNATVPGDA